VIESFGLRKRRVELLSSKLPSAYLVGALTATPCNLMFSMKCEVQEHLLMVKPDKRLSETWWVRCLNPCTASVDLWMFYRELNSALVGIAYGR
jgi:hypothetical protein